MDRELDPELFKAESPYESEVKQGATVVPRSLWFVDIDTDDALGFNPQEPLVHSSERALSRAGDGWEVEIRGQIEHQFLFHTITGSEMTHFATRDYPTAVLPLQISGNSYNLLNENTARANGLRHLANWLSDASELWEANKEESNTDTVIEYLNHWGTRKSRPERTLLRATEQRRIVRYRRSR